MGVGKMTVMCNHNRDSVRRSDSNILPPLPVPTGELELAHGEDEGKWEKNSDLIPGSDLSNFQSIQRRKGEEGAKF